MRSQIRRPGQRTRFNLALAAGLAAAAGLGLSAPLLSAELPHAPPAQTADPRPLPDEQTIRRAVDQALEYLAGTQLADGGWAQGDVSPQMRGGMQHDNHLFTQSNVADTAAVTLALMRAGNSPGSGPYAERLSRALGYICAQVEASDQESMSVTDHQGTCVQSKLGQYADTFFAAYALAEAKSAMNGEESELSKRVSAALDKTLAKIQKHQTADGGWQQQGWATMLSQGIGQRALSKAAQAGAPVTREALEGAQKMAINDFGGGGAGLGGAAAEKGAGVELYARAANLQSLMDADAANKLVEKDIRDRLADENTPADERKELEGQLESIDKTREMAKVATTQAIDRLADEQFVAGFGSNGGEEFLSYLHLAEAICGDTASPKRDEAWASFRRGVVSNMLRVQEQDGSWSGHHCITGKTFCTAVGLQVLLMEPKRDACCPVVPAAE